MSFHRDICVQIYAEVANRGDWGDVIITNPDGQPRNLVLPSAGGAPQHFRFGCVQLKPITAHPKCYVIYARSDLLQQLMCCRWCTSAIDLRVVCIKMWVESVLLNQMQKISSVE
jgi:hypothetical protein